MTPEEHAVLAQLGADVKKIVAWQERHAPSLEKLIRDDVERSELVREVKRRVIGWGVIATFTAALGVIWFGFKAFLGKV